ncbi:hypothetical protein QN277_028664 [Acacia crassicarpa]|uniref:Uncharacterized protein n=1 Tax=Acacia crassicarpa TaxID=499986 RepID=A0AAE1J7W3_9FABA|nr:hypothetical protein QN277_028664 [Acacia crassicarpa]
MASVLASASPTLRDSLDDSAEFALDFSAKLRIDGLDLNNADEEDEFSFVCGDVSQNFASADELFHNGQIRPKFPLFVQECGGDSPLRPPLKKLFVERQDISSPALNVCESVEWNRAPPQVGSFYRWSNKKTTEVLNRRCEKSSSTGFSKLWRFRDLKLRSNSDGKDAFLFLTAISKKRTSSATAEAENAANIKETAEKANSGEVKNDAVRKSKSKMASWGPEKHYVMIRARKESDKRRSYLPYRQDLVGFFTNVKGFTRNVHPF